MTDVEQPIQADRAARLGPGAKRPGTLLLYGDKLAYVPSWVIVVCAGAGFMALAAVGVAVLHTGFGVFTGTVGVGGGLWIGAEINTRRAPRKVAAAGSAVIVIPLDSIARIEGRQLSRNGARRLVITTAQGTEHWFGVKPVVWFPALVEALAARGRSVATSPRGLEVSSVLGQQAEE